MKHISTEALKRKQEILRSHLDTHSRAERMQPREVKQMQERRVEFNAIRDELRHRESVACNVADKMGELHDRLTGGRGL